MTDSVLWHMVCSKMNKLIIPIILWSLAINLATFLVFVVVLAL